jgi:hypothetical protein
LHLGCGVVRGVAECLHGLPEHRAAGASDLLELPRLALERPRLGLESLGLFEVGLRLVVTALARQPRAEAEVGERQRVDGGLLATVARRLVG